MDDLSIEVITSQQSNIIICGSNLSGYAQIFDNIITCITKEPLILCCRIGDVEVRNCFSIAIKSSAIADGIAISYRCPVAGSSTADGGEVDVSHQSCVGGGMGRRCVHIV